jgi:TonB family protein
MKGRINYQLNREEITAMRWYSKKMIFLSGFVIALFLACSIDNPQEIKSVDKIESPYAKMTNPDAYLEVSDLDVKPTFIKKGTPKYPEIARRAGIDGRATVLVLIDETGKVVEADTLDSPHPSIGAAAIEAALQIDFSPGEKNGEKVKSRMSIPFDFRLKNDTVGNHLKEVYDFIETTVKPELVKKATPKYPDDARRAGIDGRVKVIIILDEGGKVVRADILDSPHTSLNSAAIEAAMKSEFKPAEKNGKKVKSKMTLPYIFRLKE